MKIDTGMVIIGIGVVALLWLTYAVFGDRAALVMFISFMFLYWAAK
jgi:hypothetical protein